MPVDAQAALQSAQELLEQLTKPTHDGPVATGIMNPGHIAGCKGLVFQTFTKMGAGIGYEHSSGFVILKTANGWTAPSFIDQKGVSLGITVGYNKVQALLVLYSDRAVEEARKGKWKIGVDFNLVVATADMGSDAGFDFTAKRGEDCYQFAIGKGLIADLSLRGSEVSHDDASNAAFYGGSPSVAALLDGSVPPPAQFAPLYKRLDELAATGGVPGTTFMPHATTAADRNLLPA